MMGDDQRGSLIDRIKELLGSSPVVCVVGFHGSGKSTLAENLNDELRAAGRFVIHQNASSWIRYTHPRPASSGDEDATVDPEILFAVERLEHAGRGGVWIVDDAEVMLAYATEEILHTLRGRLRRCGVSLVLIRNRFVSEGGGWFQRRQSAIAVDIPALLMRPMRPQEASEVASAMFDGPARIQQGTWLAVMSGGIPGLMSELYRYTPPWPPDDPSPQLRRFALQKSEELGLQKPLRQLLFRAMRSQVLPPMELLSEAARPEIGILLLSGMASPEYGLAAHPFNGEFWHLLAQGGDGEYSIPDSLQDLALNVEIMVRAAGPIEALNIECGVAADGVGALARALAAAFYCQERFPKLVRPLDHFFGETLGKYGLAQILRARQIAFSPTTSSIQFAQLLFESARS